MKKVFYACTICLFVVSCSPKSDQTASRKPQEGTWLLVSRTTTRKDSVTIEDLSKQRSIKMLNATHFSFFTHEKDSSLRAKVDFVSGAGSYTLTGTDYTEFLEYCNFREWENKSFNFKLEYKGDSLIQSGEEEIKELGIKQVIVEKYVREK